MKRVKNTESDPHLDWIGGGNPGAIERQESQGQKDLIESAQLPKKLNGYREETAVEQYELMGIKVLGDSKDDNLFLDVVLPEGWRKQATDHSMWNNLVDDKGRVRAMFFYKAAFYDRDAFIRFKSRYELTTDYSEDNFYAYQVKDTATNQVLFTTRKVERSEYHAKGQELEGQCREFLNTNFPDWKNINAYWD